MDMDLERFADLLTGLIEKYATKIDLDSLPDPPRPEEQKTSVFFRKKIAFLMFKVLFVV